MTDTPTSAKVTESRVVDSSAQSPPRRDVLEVLKSLAEASAVISAFVYVFARVALDQFYSPLGVTPEEAGWDATTVLARFAFPLTILLLLAVYLVVIFQQDKLTRGGSLRSLFWDGWGRLLLIVVVIGMGVVLILFARNRMNILRRGEPLTVSLDSAMPISAPCVHAFWIDLPDPARANLPAFGPEHRFFLLGGSGDTTVLYDATIDAALRVPKSRVVLQNCGK